MKELLSAPFRRLARSTWPRFAMFLLCQFVILTGVSFLRSVWLLFRTTEVFFWKVLYQRSFPLILIVCLLAAAMLLWLCFLSRQIIKETLQAKRSRLHLFLIITLAGLALGSFIYFSRYGLEKDNLFFGKPTVPLLEWHLVAAFLLCLSWFLIENLRPGGIPTPVVNFLPLIIWLAAFIIWTSIPNQLGFFSPAGRAPNFEVYPYSDGSFYGHYARAAAAGMGFKGNDIPPRPLYIALLSFLHFLADNEYDGVILFQTLLLALLPAVIYLIGKEIHSVSAGLFAATLVILRETNAIYSAPFAHNVSSTKYFFSDIPTALGCAFLLLMLLRWLKKRRNPGENAIVEALLSGCALGIMTLIRTQSLFLLLLLLPLIFSSKSGWRKTLVQALCFAFALCTCVTPWLVRNYRITGRLIFDHPMTQTAELARSYNFDGQDLSRMPDENDGAYTERLSKFIAASAREHSSEIMRFVSVHFLNNLICNLRLFPVRQELMDPAELLLNQKPFWETLDNDQLQLYNLLVLGSAWLLFALGLTASTRKGKTEGFLPLLVLLLYNLSTALGRYSAGRYLIPVDWIVFLYFAIAAADWCCILMRLSGGTPQVEKETASVVTAVCSGRLIAACICIFLTAAAIPASEHLFPRILTPASEAELKEVLGEVSSNCAQKDLIRVKALAIYPRWYAAGEGEPESAKQGYAAVDHARLVFLMLAPDNFGTIEMVMEEAPQYLPDGAVVWLEACQNGATSVANKLYVASE